MTMTVIDKPLEQDLIKNDLTWEEYKSIKASFENIPNIRLCYYQGTLEIMTLSKAHEMIKCMIALLLGQYFLSKNIEFSPSGSYTQKREGIVEYESDLSYCLGQDKVIPDLCIEVNLSSGGKEKLKKYLLMNIPEVWIWRKNQIYIYSLINDNYQEQNYSLLLPELNIKLLTRCVLIPSKLEAIKTFSQSV